MECGPVKKKQPYVVIAFTKFLVCFTSAKSFVLLLTLYKKVDFMQKKMDTMASCANFFNTRAIADNRK